MANTFNFAINFYPQLGSTIIVCHSQDEINLDTAYGAAMEAMNHATAVINTSPKEIVEMVAKCLREELGCETVIVRADVTANVKGYPMPMPKLEDEDT